MSIAASKNGINNSRIFIDRNSILTELLKSSHFQAIRLFFYSLLVIFVIKDILSLSITSRTTFGLATLSKGCSNFHLGIILWIFLLTAHLLIYPVFHFWIHTRQQISIIFSLKKSCDAVALAILLLYYICSLYYVPYICSQISLGLIASTAVQVENMRLMMKTYSFIRNLVPRVLKCKSYSNQILDLPRYSNYLYFSFAPTLLYRDEYPRRKNVDIQFTLQCFLDLLCSIWLPGFLLDNTLPKLHLNAGLTKRDQLMVLETAVSVFDTFTVGLIAFLCAFYIIFHCWLNITGELLRFADREFYQEWWMATNISNFFRQWNSVVQDWLHIYVYKEFKENITPKNKFVPKIMVLFISSLGHEYVVSCIFKQFFPTMFISYFLIATPLAFINANNTFCKVLVIAGVGLWSSAIMNFGVLEYNAKFNCPIPKNQIHLYYIPRILTADCY